MNLRHLRVGTRLAVGFGTVLTILVMAVAASITLMTINKSRLLAGMEKANTKSDLTLKMKSALLEGGIAMRNMLDPTAMGRQKARVDTQNQRYEESRRKLLELDLNAEEKQILSEIVKWDGKTQNSYRLAIQQAENMNGEAAASIITNYIDPFNLKVVADIDRMVQLQRRQTQQLFEASTTADRRLTMALIAASSVAIGIGICFAWLITRSVTVPLSKATEVAARVADGDLAFDLTDDGSDETGQLMAALGRMNGSLAKIAISVRTGTDAINVASREIAEGNASLSSRTQDQAMSLEETASSMEQMTKAIQQNAEHARDTNRLVDAASHIAARGGDVVGKLVHTVGQIRDSSRRVGDITAVIDSIAFQTNILALNASVEAARAGEHGRGFSVVAAEVRNLARSCSDAAKEIKGLIDDAEEKVNAGECLAEDAGAAMAEVVGSVNKVAGIMAEILHASEEQSVGITQINQMIAQLDVVTQHNAAMVEQVSAAAYGLQDQAAALELAVAILKVPSAPMQTNIKKPILS